MNAQGFAFVLIAALGATIALAVWKTIGSKRPPRNDEWLGSSGGMRQSFIGRLSWFAVPWPLFIAITILAGPYIWAVVLSYLTS